MKRVPPSVRLKEEIEGFLGSATSRPATEEPPMVGFVGRLARYMLQVAIEGRGYGVSGARALSPRRSPARGLAQRLRTETRADRGRRAGARRAAAARDGGPVSADGR